jgi:hypothetical protein
MAEDHSDRAVDRRLGDEVQQADTAIRPGQAALKQQLLARTLRPRQRINRVVVNSMK